MGILYNISLAWVSMILVGLLSIIFILRVVNKKFFINEKNLIYKINRFFRKHHIPLGIILLITGLVHGLLSSMEILSFNFGTFIWIISILLGLNYMFKKRFRKIKGWMFYHRILSLSMVIFLIIHIVEVGGFIGIPKAIKVAQSQNSNQDNISLLDKQKGDNDSINDATNTDTYLYKNGTYYGEANGFGPGLKVKVVVKKGEISTIEIIDHNERKKSYYGYPMKIIPELIIESQSPAVDSVSGATMTSYGIMNAVYNALKDAVISGEMETVEIPTNTNRNKHKK